MMVPSTTRGSCCWSSEASCQNSSSADGAMVCSLRRNERNALLNLPALVLIPRALRGLSERCDCSRRLSRLREQRAPYEMHVGITRHVDVGAREEFEPPRRALGLAQSKGA